MKVSGRTVRRTLAFVNRVRVEHGRRPLQKLPKGLPCEPELCPIGMAIHGKAFSDELRIGEERIPVPQYVTAFVDAFDDERIPELIKR